MAILSDLGASDPTARTPQPGAGPDTTVASGGGSIQAIQRLVEQSAEYRRIMALTDKGPYGTVEIRRFIELQKWANSQDPIAQQYRALELKGGTADQPNHYPLTGNSIMPVLETDTYGHPTRMAIIAAAAIGGVTALAAAPTIAGSAAGPGGTSAAAGGAIPASAGAAGTGAGFVPAGASSAIAGRSLLGTILSGAIPTAADLIAAKIQSDAINRSTDISASTAKEALDYLKAQKAKHEAAWQPFADLSAQALAHPPAARPDAGPPPAPFTGYPGPGQSTLSTLGTSPPPGGPTGPPRMPIGGQGPSTGAPMPGPGQPQPGPQGGGFVTLEAPDGTRQQVPAAMVQALVARGARQVSP